MKTAIVYWSSTGNTKAMAETIAEGARAAGAEVDLLTAAEFDTARAGDYGTLAFGCPAMGAEELEDAEFAPMFEAVKPLLRGKRIALFGSYGWGDGKWMRNWEEDCVSAGCVFAADSVICNESPDDEAQDACRALGKVLAEG